MATAEAHPHVFVDARAHVLFDAEGRITAVRHVWRFDDAFSAFASQGLDTNGDGILTVEELQPLAKVNVDSLKDYDYFTFLRVGGRRSGFKIPTEYWLQDDGGRLILHASTQVPWHVRRIVSRAIEPTEPSFPKKLPVVLVATLATFLIALATVVTRELLNGRGEAPAPGPRWVPVGPSDGEAPDPGVGMAVFMDPSTPS